MAVTPTSPAGLDLDRLRRHLQTAHPDLAEAAATATLTSSGRSNLTYRVGTRSSGFVLRRPREGAPPASGPVLAREFQVLTALSGTAVPVPQPLHWCADPDVIGAPFYLMRHVSGTVYRSRAQSAGLGAADRRRLVESMMDTLAALHLLAPADIGLGDFGHPRGFLARQLRRWSTQLDHSRSRRLPGIDALRDALAASVPPPVEAKALLHGDYRLSNLIVGPTDSTAGTEGGTGTVDTPGAVDTTGMVDTAGAEDTAGAARDKADGAVGADGPPRVSAVLGWEMATLGDPLTDLGLLVAHWDALGAMPAAANPVVDVPGPAGGLPDSSELIDRYAKATGTDIPDLSWYVALGSFKLAVICEGMHYRYTLGQNAGNDLDRVGDLVTPLVRHGLDALGAPHGLG